MTFKASAIEYNDELPRLMAKGRGYLAEKIVELAERNDITVYRDSDLAEVLDSLEPDTYSPEDLFKAVAMVLAHCYNVNSDFREKIKTRGIK